MGARALRALPGALVGPLLGAFSLFCSFAMIQPFSSVTTSGVISP
jgi:hypothetical protein